VLRLVEERQVLLFEIHELDVELAVRRSPLEKPLPDGQPHAARPRARDDDAQFGHENLRALSYRLPSPEVSSRIMRPSAAVSTLLFLLSVAAGVLVGLLTQTRGADPIAFVAPVGMGLFLGIFLAASVKVVAQWERMIVLRLGKFQGIAEPGLRLLIPVIDTPMFVEMRVQTVAIAQQQAITQDNVPVVVNGVIFFRVNEPEAAALKVQDYRSAIWRLAQATLRDVAGRLSLDELLSHQVRLESEITQNIAAQSKAWGLHVDAIKLEDIAVPEELKK